MASNSKVLYTGVTNNLERRVYEHKQGLLAGFSSKYRTKQLVYFEAGSDIRSAIEREKQVKGWLRAKKVALIKSANPNREDLSRGWYDDFGQNMSKEAEMKKDKNSSKTVSEGKLGRRVSSLALRMTKKEVVADYIVERV